MDLLESLLAGFAAWLPVFVRVATFIFATPLFGRGVPPQTRAGFATFLALLLTGAVPLSDVPQDLAGYLLVIVEEVGVGLAMGLVVSMVVSAVYLAGQLLDIPIGFSMVNVFDPEAGIQTPVLSQFHYVIAILVLFGANGHHALLRALADSFALFPPGAAWNAAASLDAALAGFARMFELGVRIALPVIGALFLVDVALGIVARAVPQVNVFFVGFPLKIGLGIALLILTLPVYAGFAAYLFGGGGEMIQSLYRMMSAIGASR